MQEKRRREQPSNMRKYYKLALFILTGFSLVCFLFYKTQYDRLYNALQVLEYFGRDGAGGPPESTCEVSSCAQIRPPPSFRSLDRDSVSVYSAFCADQDCGDGVVLLAILRADVTIDPLGCQVWYEGLQSPSSSAVVQEVEDLNEMIQDKFRAAAIHCWDAENNNKNMNLIRNLKVKIPHGVVLSKDKDEVFVPVDRHPNHQNEVSYSGSSYKIQPGSFGACILPQMSKQDVTYEAAETILLSSYFGLKHFLIYDGGGLPSSKFYHKILNKARAINDPGLDVRVVPFDLDVKNVPEEAVEALVREDCMRRTAGLWENTLILSIGQILVPGKGFYTVQKALRAFEKQDEEQSNPHMKLPTLKFCPEFPATSREEGYSNDITALEQTRHVKSITNFVDLISSTSSANAIQDDFVTVSSDFLTVNDYRTCGEGVQSESVEDSRLTGKVAEAILNTFGQLFPYKSV